MFNWLVSCISVFVDGSKLVKMALTTCHKLRYCINMKIFNNSSCGTKQLNPVSANTPKGGGGGGSHATWLWVVCASLRIAYVASVSVGFCTFFAVKRGRGREEERERKLSPLSPPHSLLADVSYFLDLSRLRSGYENSTVQQRK